MNHDVISVIDEEVGDSAARLDLEEACISLLKILDPNALTIADASKVETGGISALFLDKRANLELVNWVRVVAGASPVGVLCVRAISSGLAAETLGGNVNDHFCSTLDTESVISQDAISTLEVSPVGICGNQGSILKESSLNTLMSEQDEEGYECRFVYHKFLLLIIRDNLF